MPPFILCQASFDLFAGDRHWMLVNAGLLGAYPGTQVFQISKMLICVSFKDSTFLIVILSPSWSLPHRIGDHGSYLEALFSTLFKL